MKNESQPESMGPSPVGSPQAFLVVAGLICVVAMLAGCGRPAPVEPDGGVAPGGHWVQLDLRGTRGGDNKSRSNSSAIGARVEIKTGGVFQQFVVGGASGPVAAAPLRIHAGLGENTQIDWLRILWPDAVLQAELELAADRVVEVTELARKTSSCPYLFSWDGSHYQFVADFVGVGGLGYLVAPGA